MTTNPTVVETPAPVAVPDELRGLSPDELAAHVALVEAQVEAARAEAKARADAHQERWWSAIWARRRRLAEEVPARLDAFEAEVRTHRSAFEAAARDGDLLAAWSAYLARTEAEATRVTASNEQGAARQSLDPDSSSTLIGLWGPTAEQFAEEFLALATTGAAERARERFAAEFGEEPVFEDFAE